MKRTVFPLEGFSVARVDFDGDNSPVYEPFADMGDDFQHSGYFCYSFVEAVMTRSYYERTGRFQSMGLTTAKWIIVGQQKEISFSLEEARLLLPAYTDGIVSIRGER